MSEATSNNTAVDVLDTSDGGSSIAREIQNVANGNAAFLSTITGNDFDAKVKTVEAMTNSEPVKENLNKTIQLQNVIVQAIPMANQQTGEIQDQPRVILLDSDGTAYHAISGGLWRSVQNILGIIGHPSTWPAPLSIHVVGIKGKQGGDFFTAKIGEAPSKK